ncbi:DUF413 domain-containing protein [Ferrimonas gelatinilytica]|uniref:Macrodomain Ori protein n=1 Tax=Ferrimonas gelatinilytica TaxID=1255257 RepID=A0ABP9RUX7_9GAMM
MTTATATTSNFESFHAHGLFNDPRYPRGLSRSGSFTISEAQRLEQFGEAYQALSTGARQPVNEEERHFVQVAHGLAEAETPHEKVWMKYQKTLQRRSYTLTSRPFTSHSTSAGSDDDDIELLDDED